MRLQQGRGGHPGSPGARAKPSSTRLTPCSGPAPRLLTRVHARKKRSFGTRLIETLGKQIKGDVHLTYEPAGFVYAFDVPLASLTSPAAKPNRGLKLRKPCRDQLLGTKNCRQPRRVCASAALFLLSYTFTHIRTLRLSN
jgi:hypothetical protein